MDDFTKLEINGGRYCTKSMTCTNKAVYIGKIKDTSGGNERIAYCQPCKDDEESLPEEFNDGDIVKAIDVVSLLENSDIGEIHEMQKQVIGLSLMSNKGVEEINRKLFDFVSSGVTLKEALKNVNTFFKEQK